MPDARAAEPAQQCLGITATIVGTDGPDQLRGTSGDDVIAALGGKDKIDGGGGNDVICAGAGADVILLGDGDAIVDAGGGKNRIEGGHGNSIVIGGDDDDRIDLKAGNHSVFAGAANDNVRTGGGAAFVDAGDGNDTVTTGGGGAVVLAGSGKDSLRIGNGDDRVDGEAGKDRLRDRGGTDTCIAIERSKGCETKLTVLPVALVVTRLPAAVGQSVLLDGSGSYDPAGELITFNWVLLRKPGASAAALEAADDAQPTFTPDVAGVYMFELTVATAGATSLPRRIVMIASERSAPVADAGRDRPGRAGQSVSLDGSASGETAGLAVTYDWSVVAVPRLSRVTTRSISDRAAARAEFTPDRSGVHELRLDVSNGNERSADTVRVLVAKKTPPFADAGRDAEVLPDEEALLSAARSFDPDSKPKPLAYHWTLVARPIGSAVTSNSLDDRTAASPRYQPDAAGTYVWRLQVDDGKTKQFDNVAHRVSLFQVLPTANQTTGPAPLTVTFRARAIYRAGAILQYCWDFTSDGIEDACDPGEQPRTFTYQQKGKYQAKLTVTNDKGEKKSKALTITVVGNAPVATAFVEPSNGAVPLDVTFNGSASDRDGDIVAYEWDFDGDGKFEYSSPSAGVVQRTFRKVGTYQSVFRVRDGEGNESTARVTTTAVRVGPKGSPTATITSPAAERQCETACFVSFSGSGTDPNGRIVKFEWDFDGDGVYDTSSASSFALHSYTRPGTYLARLRVTDDDGRTGVDTVAIDVAMRVTLTLGNDTCLKAQTPAADPVTINTVLGGSAPVTLRIKDREGRTRRTLVDDVMRDPGRIYTDLWDCTDDAGRSLPEDYYLVVLDYEDFNGQRRSYDVSASGGTLFNPDFLLEGSSCFTCQYTFKPLEDDLFDASLIMPRAGEVTISVRIYRLATEITRFMERRLIGRGTHAIRWDGADALGNLAVPPLGRQFIFGVTALTLPTNAIFVASAPVIDGVVVDPNFFGPAARNLSTGAASVATIGFSLSESATVTLDVIRAGVGAPVRTIRTAVDAGPGRSIAWDGRDDDGTLVARGDYRLILQATDSQGNVSLPRYGRIRVYH